MTQTSSPHEGSLEESASVSQFHRDRARGRLRLWRDESPVSKLVNDRLLDFP